MLKNIGSSFLNTLSLLFFHKAEALHLFRGVYQPICQRREASSGGQWSTMTIIDGTATKHYEFPRGQGTGSPTASNLGYLSTGQKLSGSVG